jgi:hypothetical protein
MGPPKKKSNLEKIKASLFTLCTECGYKIQPANAARHLETTHPSAVYFFSAGGETGAAFCNAANSHLPSRLTYT